MITALDQHTALILVDCQKAVMRYPLLTPAEEILANVARLVTAFRKAGLPIVHVTVDPAGAPVKAIRRDIPSLSGAGLPAEGLELAPEIETQPDDIFITKHTWGAFYNTPLDQELEKRLITGIVLAGVATSRGVESTARAASERGYNLVFAQNAMTDTIISAHENSLTTIFPRIGEVDDTDAIIRILTKNTLPIDSTLKKSQKSDYKLITLH